VWPWPRLAFILIVENDASRAEAMVEGLREQGMSVW